MGRVKEALLGDTPIYTNCKWTVFSRIKVFFRLKKHGMRGSYKEIMAFLDEMTDE